MKECWLLDCTPTDLHKFGFPSAVGKKAVRSIFSYDD